MKYKKIFLIQNIVFLLLVGLLIPTLTLAKAHVEEP